MLSSTVIVKLKSNTLDENEGVLNALFGCETNFLTNCKDFVYTIRWGEGSDKSRQNMVRLRIVCEAAYRQQIGNILKLFGTSINEVRSWNPPEAPC